ncbi:MAG TPA: transcription antitermination factor NusB, partial [Baekduia sp.]|nr:transcription antitermination factor NusB [Baekduia sp.]
MSGVSPARRVAFAVVRRVLEQNAYADRALHGEAKNIDPRERALAKRLSFGVVQRRNTLDWAIARHVDRELDPQLRAALHLGIYQLLFTEVADHAAVSEAVELAKPNRGAGLVNAVLRKILRDGLQLPPDDDVAGAAIRHSHPQWLVQMWWDWLGAERTRALLAANNEPTELALRVNTLVDADVSGLGGRRDGDALIVDGPMDVLVSKLYTAGAITPQSRASQMVAPALKPQPGERILDLCAAPGGKTTHLAALMGNQGEIVAVEKSPQRARALRATCERLGASIVTVRVADATDPIPSAPFDGVLVDPPCSGLGTLQSHPDLRWHASPEAIEQLVPLQQRILDNARASASRL